MNPFLAKMKLMGETRYHQAPSKPSKSGFEGFEGDPSTAACEYARRTNEPKRSRLDRAFDRLESHCPNFVPVGRWHQAIDDGRHFRARLGYRADRRSARDLFGFASCPNKPHPSYQRLCRYDQTGLIWLLRGRPVLPLTKETAAIESRTGAVTIDRRHHRPAIGPLVIACTTLHDDDKLLRSITPKIGGDRFRSSLRALKAKCPDLLKIEVNDLSKSCIRPTTKYPLDDDPEMEEPSARLLRCCLPPIVDDVADGDLS